MSFWSYLIVNDLTTKTTSGTGRPIWLKQFKLVDRLLLYFKEKFYLFFDVLAHTLLL